jgi:hypothetical protein
MNEAIMAVTSAEARSAGERAIANGAEKRDVALVVMQTAREGFMAPDEATAFAASIAALWELYPDDEALRQETRAVGDRNKVLAALTNGVPVDMDAVELTPLPEDALGLLDVWNESRREAARRG